MRKITPSLHPDATPEAYAAAMVLCQGYAPDCSDAGECLDEGRCFGGHMRGYAKAHNQIEGAIKEAWDDVNTRVWLKLALDALEHHRFLARGCDVLKVVAINRRVRDDYGMTKG